jgi:FkbH-like protein
MLLRREHLSAWAIGWEPKPDGIPAIAKRLNIGIDSLVFIDDSSMEVAYMRAAQPDVTSIQLPEDPADIVPFMQRLRWFDTLEITDEDRARADMMRAERDRETLVTGLSKEDFQRALDLRIDLAAARAEDLGRVTQLINKTNQFNLTTIRRTLDEVRELATARPSRVYALRVADKFGDYGLTGVVIIEPQPARRRWVIDTLLMSCRVLGRGVETALLAALAQDARAVGAETMVASFVPTKKNALAERFLPDHGFRASADGSWEIAVADVPPISSFITRAPAVEAA